MSLKMSLWILLLFLLAFVSMGDAGECLMPVLTGNVVLSITAILKNDFPDGSEVTLRCAAGYVVDQGSNTITCVGGEWSKQELTCKKKNCGVPASSPNMQYHIPNGTLFGAYVTPVCDRGYHLQGSSHRQCLTSGWTGRSECLLVTCGTVPVIVHSIIVSLPLKEIPEFEDIIEYSCEDKYTLVGNGSVVCQENGKYSALPQCKEKDCDVPASSLNMQYLIPNGTLFGAYVTPVCDSGYRLQGSSYRQCLETGWTGRPECILVTCGTVPVIAHSIIVSLPLKEIPEFEDIIEYSCDDKYSLIGNGSVVCQENGEYGSLPQCKEREGDERDSPYRVPSVIVVTVIGLSLIIITSVLVQRYQKHKGSYDTGEEKKTKERLMQEESISYLKYQSKDP